MRSDGTCLPRHAERQAPASFERLVLFDGLCGFCDRAVRWLLDHPKRTAELRAPTAAADTSFRTKRR